MPLFEPMIPRKPEKQSHHPWQNRIQAQHSNAYKHAHNSVTNPIFTTSKTKEISKNTELYNTNDRIKFTVIGNRITKEFIYCVYLVKGLHKCRPKRFEAPVIRGLTGVEWPKVWNDLKLKFGGLAFCLKSQVAILKDNEFLGGEDELKEFVETRYVYNAYIDYYKEGIQQFANFIKSSGRPCVYMHISISSVPAGCLIFMLYSDIAPFTCQNFMKMCQSTRGGYSGTPIHRIVQDCWIQCGGFALRSPNELDCENFIVPHDRRGVLGMVNNGRHVDCSTQFFVLLQPAPWMNNRFVAFGQLIEGEKTLRKIENVKTWYESPTSDIIIDEAGILNLECQRIPINKNVNNYIEGHIEDLVALGKLFYEALLNRVFDEIEIRILQQPEKQNFEDSSDATEEEEVKIERLMRKKGKHSDEASNNGSSENNDFDVEEYQYEENQIYDERPRDASVASTVKIPTKLYYLPLTDVTYPDEVDSIYDLKKLLRGDYCLESDLAQPIRTISKESSYFKVPKEIIDTLFDYLTIEVELSDSSLSEDDENLVKNYLFENNDSVSFAGRIVGKMANLPQRLKLFDGSMNEQSNRDVLADEDLRLIRVVHKEITSSRKKHVSMVLPDSQLPHGLVRRRPTGFVYAEHLPYLVGEDWDDDDIDDEDKILMRTSSALPSPLDLSKDKIQRHEALMYPDDTESICSKGRTIDERKVKIASTLNLQKQIPNRIHDRLTSFLLDEEANEIRRTSLLQRLYNEFDGNDDGEAPTLKHYKPLTEKSSKNFLLTNSHCDLGVADVREKYFRRASADEGSIDHILHIQHGKRVSRKISCDYVRTIDQIEQEKKRSIRSVEYAKRRPSMSVQEYQQKNREKLSNTEDKMTETCHLKKSTVKK